MLALPVDAQRTATAEPEPRGTASAPVFLSYSRRDFYFAESLAHELRRRGVAVWLDVNDLVPGGDWHEQILAALDAAPCLVLVASRESADSPHVAGEWLHALGRGARVVVVRWRGSELPVRLNGLETVDFRGRFRPAVDELAALLARDVTAPHEPGQRRRVPPWIAALTAALGLVSLAPFVLADYDATSSLAYQLLTVVVFWALFFRLFVVAFARRRMSMLRLALTFGYVAAALGYLLLQLYASAPAFYGDATVRTARAAPWLPAATLVVSLAALAAVLLVRPRDLLRWTPTGHAWDVYRPPLAAPASPETPLRFRLVHDEADAPAADRLRRELRGAGAVESDDGHATAVLLLTNRTRPDWLDAQSGLRDGGLLTVVGTGVRTLPSLDWLWKRQVLDFRRWTAEPPTHALVPEAFATRRPPTAVRSAHRVLCAFGALAFAAGGAIADVEGASAYAVAVGYTAAILGAACALAAHLLVRRSTSLALLARVAPFLAAATVAAGFLALQQVDAAAARLAAPAAFLVAAPLWLALRTRALRFWLPVPEALPDGLRQAAPAWLGERVDALGSRFGSGERVPETLEPGRSWSTLLWFFGFAVVWLGVLGGT
jgi:hypothetical protein